MTITKTSTPYEFLARWKNGELAGAHVKFLETITDDGVIVNQREGDPVPVALAGGAGFPLADLLSTLQADAIAERDAAVAAKDAAVAALAAKDAEIAALEAQVAALTSAPPTDPLGPAVDDLQIRLALTKVGLRDTVETAIAESGNTDLQDWYERAKTFKRYHPLVVELIGAIKATEEQADQVWALAATL